MQEDDKAKEANEPPKTTAPVAHELSAVSESEAESRVRKDDDASVDQPSNQKRGLIPESGEAKKEARVSENPDENAIATPDHFENHSNNTVTQAVVKSLQEPNVSHNPDPEGDQNVASSTAVGPSDPKVYNKVSSAHEAITGTSEEIRDTLSEQAEKSDKTLSQATKNDIPVQSTLKVDGEPQVETLDVVGESEIVVTNDAEELKKRRRSVEADLDNSVVKKLKQTGQEPIAGTTLLKDEIETSQRQPSPGPHDTKQEPTKEDNSGGGTAMVADTPGNKVPTVNERLTVSDALYISNLTRPIQIDQFRTHLEELAGKKLVSIFLDTFKTHAFVVLDSQVSAEKVHSGLHNRVWPENEKHRKPLKVQYLLAQEAERFEKQEKAAERGIKWEVKYISTQSGIIAKLLKSESDRAESQTVTESSKSFDHATKQQPQKTLKLDALFRKSVTKPVLYYLPVSSDVQESRLLESSAGKQH